MSKLLTAVLAAVFAVMTVSPVAFAQEKKEEMKTKTEARKKTQTADEKKAARAAVAKACKGKKPGEEVTVDGKKVKCPAPRKVQKKAEK